MNAILSGILNYNWRIWTSSSATSIWNISISVMNIVRTNAMMIDCSKTSWTTRNVILIVILIGSTISNTLICSSLTEMKIWMNWKRRMTMMMMKTWMN